MTVVHVMQARYRGMEDLSWRSAKWPDAAPQDGDPRATLADISNFWKTFENVCRGKTLAPPRGCGIVQHQSGIVQHQNV